MSRALQKSEQSYIQTFAPRALAILGVLIGALGMYWYLPPGTSAQPHTVDNYLNSHEVSSELKRRLNEAHREQIPSPAALVFSVSKWRRDAYCTAGSIWF